MVRAARIWPNIYFGRPGALTTLPWPRGDIGRSYDKAVADFVTGTGQHLVGTQAQGSRAYVLAWTSMHADNFALIEQYWTGMQGVGPWAIVDPSMSNMLLPNQASATSNLNDTTGWKTSTGATNEGTLFSNSATAFIHRAGAPRSLQWQFTVAPITFPILTITAPYRNWFGIPVVPTLPYTVSAWMTPDGVIDTSITMNIRITWRDAAGNQLSESISADTPITTWTKLSATGNAPSNAAYGSMTIVATGSSITTGGSVYIDEPMLEQDSAVNTWAPGVGLRAVEMLALTETSPFDAKFRKDINLALRELVA